MCLFEELGDGDLALALGQLLRDPLLVADRRLEGRHSVLTPFPEAPKNAPAAR